MQYLKTLPKINTIPFTPTLLQHNNLLLTQQERLTAELLTPTSENSCKSRKKDVIQMENNIRLEEIPAKSGISKANKLPLKKITQE